MTGFARAAGQDATHRWIWEAKSVNGRSLDLRLRVPPGYDRLEGRARQKAGERFSRGSVSLSLTVETQAGAGALTVNREFLERLIDLHGAYAGRVNGDLPRIETLLGVRGVVDTGETAESEETVQARDGAILESLATALADLQAARRAEGARLESVLAGHLATLDRLCERAADSDGARIEAIRARLDGQLGELLSGAAGLPEERLAQEIALLATKADVREEIDRLRSHCASAREMLSERVPVGRRLDFLCQEFNREANTLCSKSTTEDLTRIGLDFKATIDQFREQAQNVE